MEYINLKLFAYPIELKVSRTYKDKLVDEYTFLVLY